MDKLNETDKKIIVTAIQLLSYKDYSENLQTIKDIYKKLEIIK